MNSETDANADLLPAERSATTRGPHASGSSTNGSTRRSRAATPPPERERANFLQYLPFDPWRLVEALRLRWYWMVLGGGGLALAGFVFGLATTHPSDRKSVV